MRILHTSDWHLGRSFHRVGMLSAQAAVLDHLVQVVRSERVDVVIIAGDVYDRALPAVDVVALLDEALNRLVDAGAAVVVSPGNHDSAPRLAFGSRLLARAGVHIRCDPQQLADPVLMPDRDGPVAVYPLPYLEPALVAPQLGCPASHRGVLVAAMDAVRADLATRPAGTRSVVAAHAFVVGGQVSDSERDISVGGVAAVPAGAFDGVSYVALGHLHRRQQLAATVRYSGSPLAYSFSEAGQVKGALLISLDRAGQVEVEPVDCPAPRPLAVLRGDLDGLLTRPELTEHEQAWCQVTLTDGERQAHAMERLRARFPHTLELRFDPRGARPGQAQSYAERVTGRDDVEICCDFLRHVRGRGASPQELGWLREAVQAQRLAETERLVGGAGVATLRRGSSGADGVDLTGDTEPEVDVAGDVSLEEVG